MIHSTISSVFAVDWIIVQNVHTHTHKYKKYKSMKWIGLIRFIACDLCVRVLFDEWMDVLMGFSRPLGKRRIYIDNISIHSLCDIYIYIYIYIYISYHGVVASRHVSIDDDVLGVNVILLSFYKLR